MLLSGAGTGAGAGSKLDKLHNTDQCDHLDSDPHPQCESGSESTWSVHLQCIVRLRKLQYCHSNKVSLVKFILLLSLVIVQKLALRLCFLNTFPID